MELMLAERKAVTTTIASRYARSDKGREESGPRRVVCATAMAPQPGTQDAQASAATEDREGHAPATTEVQPESRCGAALLLGMATRKRLAPMLAELVEILRRFGELDIEDNTATLLAGMSAATIDHRLAGERKKHELKGCSLIKPGSPDPGPHLGARHAGQAAKDERHVAAGNEPTPRNMSVNSAASCPRRPVDDRNYVSIDRRRNHVGRGSLWGRVSQCRGEGRRRAAMLGGTLRAAKVADVFAWR